MDGMRKQKKIERQGEHRVDHYSLSLLRQNKVREVLSEYEHRTTYGRARQMKRHVKYFFLNPHSSENKIDRSKLGTAYNIGLPGPPKEKSEKKFFFLNSEINDRVREPAGRPAGRHAQKSLISPKLRELGL